MSEFVYPGTDKYSMAELMAIIVAREMAGDEEKIGGGGAASIIPLAATRLAQLTVAPDLWLLGAGAGMMNGKFDTLPLGTWDPRLGIGAECRIYMIDVVDEGLQGQERERVPRVIGFGGMQIDKYGNINMIGIGPYPKLKVRGPGTVGTIWLGSRDVFIFTEHHSCRIFVEKVDHISGAGWLDGWTSRHKVLNGRPGPYIVFTPICVCDFTEDEHRMRLVSVHPGYQVSDVVENTGFELVIPDNVPMTAPPSAWELEMLRTRVDRGGQLRRKKVTVG